MWQLSGDRQCCRAKLRSQQMREPNKEKFLFLVLNFGVGGICCTTLRVVINATRSVAQLNRKDVKSHRAVLRFVLIAENIPCSEQWGQLFYSMQ